MKNPINNDFFDLREEYEKETNLKAFEKETYANYINWLEKRLVEKLIIPVVVVNEADNWCTTCQKPIRMTNNTLQLLCECEVSEVELVCDCTIPDICQDNTGLIYCFTCKRPMAQTN